MWKTILFGYTFPTNTIDWVKTKKSLEEYDDEENKKFQLNSRAIYILVCAMDMNEYNAKWPKKFREYLKLHMKELTKSRILKLEFLLMNMKCLK